MGELTLGVELGALVEDTKALGTRAGTDEVGESARKNAGVDIGGVTSVGGRVAARELSLVTTLGLGLLDGQAVRDGEARSSLLSGDGSGKASKGEDSGGESELHLEDRVLKD